MSFLTGRSERFSMVVSERRPVLPIVNKEPVKGNSNYETKTYRG